MVEKGIGLRELDTWDIDEFSQYLAYLELKAEIESKVLDDLDSGKTGNNSEKNVTMDWDGNVLNGK
jgi:hypothetical protein